nr:MAG TPA: hypothetical protein [Bacteriophage sp.]
MFRQKTSKKYKNIPGGVNSPGSFILKHILYHFGSLELLSLVTR